MLFLSCKANARVKLAKSVHGPHLFRIIAFCVVPVIVLSYCLYAVLLLLCCTVIVLLCYYLCCPMYWLCVLYHCHRVLAQFQLTNISYHIILQEEKKKFCQESESQRWDLNPVPSKYEVGLLTDQSRSSFEATWFSGSAGCIPCYCLPVTKVWWSLPRTRGRIPPTNRV